MTLKAPEELYDLGWDCCAMMDKEAATLNQSHEDI